MQPAPAADAPAVLLVDDDEELVDLLQNYLEREGFAVGRAENGEEGVREALSGRYAIAVVDMMMPRLGGMEVVKVIRSSSTMPVIILTAKGEDTDRIVGLEMGADDYVAKPCLPRELLARIRAVLRRTQGAPAAVDAGAVIHAGALTLDPGQRRVQCEGITVPLTSTEFNVLEVLARNLGTPTNKQELSEQALGRRLAAYDRSIDVHVSSIRQKLPLLKDGRSRILTVRGRGYQLVAE